MNLQQVSDHSESHRRITFLPTINSLFWFVYLLLIAVISFANTSIYSQLWLSICAVVFLYSGLYCGFLCFVQTARLKALYAARFAIIVIFLSCY